MLVAVSLTLALQHLFIWLIQARQWAHLALSLTALAVAIMIGMEYSGMRAANVNQLATILRWVHLPFFVTFVAMIYFVRHYFGVGRLWLAWTACGLRLFVLVINFTTGQNLFFKEITHLKPLVVFGGETVVIAQGVLNPWYVIGPISILALVVFVLDASLMLWRKGGGAGRLFVFNSITFFMLAAVVHLGLVNAGLLNSPYLVSLSFMPALIAMSYTLSYDVMRSVKLADQLQASETELRKNEQRMALAISAAELGVWEWDVVHDEIWSNDKGRALFGIPGRERISFSRFLGTLHKDDRALLKCRVDQSLAGGGDYEGEYRVVLPDGQIRWFTTHSHLEFDSHHCPLRMYGVSIDITQRKQAAQALIKQGNKQTHLARATLLGELSMALAHELNQPLAAILSNAQAAQRFLLRKESQLCEVQEILEDIIADNKRASEVILRLRLLLRNDEVQYQRLDINEVVADVVKLVRFDLEGRHISITTTLAEQLPTVLGDQVLLQQVLLNLILNGSDAAASVSHVDQTSISIRTCCDGNVVKVCVGDQGPGITTKDMAHIFEPFFTTKPHGLGLGLSICRTLIKSHNGQLWAENNPDGGANFYFTLPAYFCERR